MSPATSWGGTGIGQHTLPTLSGIVPEQMLVADYGRTIASYCGDRLSTADIALSLTQASTLTLGFEDPKRELITSCLLNEAVTIDTGANPSRRFKLVQVSKSGNKLNATYEDALISYLRTIKGQEATAPGVTSRIEFAQQLLRPLGVLLVAPVAYTQPALEPLTRGTSQNPDEDTWSCLVRLAGGVGYRCFSDGASVWFAPDDWLLNHGIPLQITERADGVNMIDFDYDVGKPVGKATVNTVAASWTAGPGAPVQVLNLAAASGRWLVSDVSRSLYKQATKAGLIVAQPTLPEPSSSDTHTVSFQASN